MLKSFINKYLKAALHELFTDAGKDSVQMSLMGSDLFSDSNINLKNLTFRPDIFDAYLYPLKLVSGHLGDLTISGVTEFALGGKLKCQAENIFLLFHVDTLLNPEYIQYLKKVLIELNSVAIQHVLIRELLKKIQGISGTKDPDFKQQRLLMLKLINFMFKSFQLVVKNIHIRIETPSSTSTDHSNHINLNTNTTGTCSNNSNGNPFYCCALGITLPYMKLAPSVPASTTSTSSSTASSTSAAISSSGTSNTTTPQKQQPRPEGVGKDDPLLNLSLNSLQIYCDYHCETYLSNGDTSAAILKQFITRWKTEVHTAMLLPFDLDIVLAAEIKKKSGLVSPKIMIHIPKLRMACDYKQLDVIQQLLALYVKSHKRCSHLVTLRATYGKDGPPKVVTVGGNHILPILSPGFYRYAPTVTSGGTGTSGMSGGVNNSSVKTTIAVVPSPVVENRIITLLKARVGTRWKKALWKHLIRVVIHDLRLTRPLGRWITVARLCLIRKEYAFIYSRLLKRSPKSGNFVYNVNARIDLATYKKLFDYDMALSITAIHHFRTLAHMICTVELFNAKRQQSVRGNSGGNGGNNDSRGTTPIKQPQQSFSSQSSSQHIFERTGITWRDILMTHTELVESLRESAFRTRPSGGSGNNNHEDDDENEPLDDSASTYSSSASPYKQQQSQSHNNNDNADTASVFSLSSRTGSTLLGDMSIAGAGAANMLNSTAKLLPRSLLSVTGVVATGGSGNNYNNNYNSNGGSSGNVVRSGNSGGSVFGGTSSLFGGGTGSASVSGVGGGYNNQSPLSLQQNSSSGSTNGNTSGGVVVDDLDSKLFGRREMSALSEFIGTLENEEKRGDGSSGSSSSSGGTQQQMVVIGSASYPILYTVYDYKLVSESPAVQTIVESVQYILLRHQKPLTIIPPDITLSLNLFDFSFRKPLIDGVRQTLAVLNASQFSVVLTITNSNAPTPVAVSAGAETSVTRTTGGSVLTGGGKSNNNAVATAVAAPMLMVKSLNGFASIVGSLVQIRVTLQSLSVQMYVYNKDLITALGGIITLDSLATGMSGSSGRGVLSDFKYNDALNSSNNIGNGNNISTRDALNSTSNLSSNNITGTTAAISTLPLNTSRTLNAMNAMNQRNNQDDHYAAKYLSLSSKNKNKTNTTGTTAAGTVVDDTYANLGDDVEWDDEKQKFVIPGYTDTNNNNKTTATSNNNNNNNQISLSTTSTTATSQSLQHRRSIGAEPMVGTAAAETKRIEALKLKQKEPLIINLLSSTTSSSSNSSGNSSNKTGSGSSNNNNFLTLCLMLDFDENCSSGSGVAADLQIALGSVTAELSAELLSFAVDDATKINVVKIGEIMSEISDWQFIHSEEAWYFADTLKLPYAEAVLNVLYDDNNDNDSKDDENEDINENDDGDSIACADDNDNEGDSNIKLTNTTSTSTKDEEEVLNNTSLEYEEEPSTTTATSKSNINSGSTAPVSSDMKGKLTTNNATATILTSSLPLPKHTHSIPDFEQLSLDFESSTTVATLSSTKSSNYGYRASRSNSMSSNTLKNRNGNSNTSSSSIHNGNSSDEKAKRLLKKQQQQLKKLYLKQRQLITTRRLQRREYMNYEYYKALLKSIIPSVFSMVLRTSTLTIDALTSLTIERLIFSESHQLADKSSRIPSRRHNNNSNNNTNDDEEEEKNKKSSILGINFMKRSYAGILVSALQDIRESSSSSVPAGNGNNNNSMSSVLSTARDRKIHLDVPGIELIVIKKMKPIQDLFVRLFSVEVKVPVTENTLYELLAVILQRNHPHYK